MKLYSWLASSLERHFPSTPARAERTLKLEGARNERLSFQVAVRCEGENVWPMTVRIEVEGDKALHAQVRRVGYVPVRHHNIEIPESERDGVGHIPGYVPDPLFPEDSMQLPVGETHAFWITLRPTAKTPAGVHQLKVRVITEGEKPTVHTHTVTVHRYNVVLKKRRDFAITHWFYIDALMDFYRTDHFDERFWAITERYLRNMTEHGLDTLLVPAFTPPIDGVKRPSQLVRVLRRSDGRYEFDWSDVKRYLDLARRCGFTQFEWSHLFTQWGATHAIRIYHDQGQDEALLWPTDTTATSDVYRDFLGQYLPELHDFLRREKLLKNSYFHLSDEPHGEAHVAGYRCARVMLQELAPWLKVMDALSELDLAQAQLVNVPVASIETVLNFVKEDLPCWAYYCCLPRGAFLNRTLDTPLPKVAMSGFLFYRWPIKGFLHWGHNYWYQRATRTLADPFSVQDGGAWPLWVYGDTFMVYPGPHGPIDSLRWEVFAESLQDYALLQTLGIERSARELSELHSFSDFPKTAYWRKATRRKLLKNAAARV